MSAHYISTTVKDTNILSEDQLFQLLLFVTSNGIAGKIKFFKEPRQKKEDTTNKIISQKETLTSGTYEFNNLEIKSGAQLTCTPWDAKSGGKLVLIVDTLKIDHNGKIHLSGVGYRGGDPAEKTNEAQAYQGESFQGVGSKDIMNNGGGGPSADYYGSIGGGGGGYGTQGSVGTSNLFRGGNRPGGRGGTINDQ